MCNKVKSEHHFPIMSAESSILPSNFKISDRRGWSQILTVITGIQHPKDSNVYVKEDAAKKWYINLVGFEVLWWWGSKKGEITV